MDETPRAGTSRESEAMSRTVFFLRLADVLLLAVLFLLSIDWWNEVPGPLPVPGDATGAAGDRGGTGFASWFALPLIGAGMTVFFFALPLLKGPTERRPWLISLPRRKTFHRLPPDARKRVIHAAFGLLSFYPLPALLFLLYGQWTRFCVATGSTETFPPLMAVLFGAVVLVATAVYLVVLDAIIRREARKAGTG